MPQGEPAGMAPMQKGMYLSHQKVLMEMSSWRSLFPRTAAASGLLSNPGERDTDRRRGVEQRWIHPCGSGTCGTSVWGTRILIPAPHSSCPIIPVRPRDQTCRKERGDIEELGSRAVARGDTREHGGTWGSTGGHGGARGDMGERGGTWGDMREQGGTKGSTGRHGGAQGDMREHGGTWGDTGGHGCRSNPAPLPEPTCLFFLPRIHSSSLLRSSQL